MLAPVNHPHRLAGPLLAALLLLLVPASAGAAEGSSPTRALRLRRVAFSGQRLVKQADLVAAVKGLLPRSRLLPAARRRVIERVREVALALLRRRGYLRAKVSITPWRPGPYVTFVVLRAKVAEGPLFRVGALDVTGLSLEKRLAALGKLTLRSGQVLGQGDLGRGAEAVATAVADRGHAFVKVTIATRPHPKSPIVDVTYRVTQGPLATVGRITVRGFSRTAELLIRRALLVRVGARYHRSGLHAALERLRRTRAFGGLKLDERRLAGNRVELLITGREKRR